MTLITVDDKELVREKISALEAEMLKGPTIEILARHYFSNGVYAREIFIPKGSLVIGKIHKFQNLNIMSQGRGVVLSIDGSKEISAPYTVVSSAGVKRAYFAHEDTTWTTILGTHEIDVDIIEQAFIAKTYDEVEMLDQYMRQIEGWE